MLDPQSVAVLHNESHIEICIVCNHHCTLAEFKKFRQNLLDRRGIHDHTVIDTGKLLDTERDRDFRVYKGGKAFCNLTILYQYRTNLNDLAGQGGESGGLDIEDYKSTVQFLTFSIGNHTF